jgi:peroxiredoxin
MNRILRLVALLCLLPPALSDFPTFRPSDLHAQVPIRARTMGDPLPGREVPAFALPYAATGGPGPAPFEIRAELGRVVVLAFCAGTTDRAAQALMGAFASRGDSLFAGDIAVAVVLPESVDSLAAVAARMRLSYKLLADAEEDVRRLFGVEKGGTAVYVVGVDGRIVWRELDFNPFLARGYADIQAAVARGRQF